MIPPTLEVPIRSEDLATALAEAALDKKAQDLVILDMRELVFYTDLFILCSASNPRQVKAIAEHLRAFAKKEWSLIAEGAEGLESGRWALVDFGDVVVHIFDGALRGFYNLDGLWADAPRLPAPEPEERSAASDAHPAV